MEMQKASDALQAKLLVLPICLTHKQKCKIAIEIPKVRKKIKK